MTRTLNYKGADLIVEYDYDAGSPMVMYYKDGTGHPGDPASIDIINITIGEIDVYELLEPIHEDIKEEIFKIEENS